MKMWCPYTIAQRNNTNNWWKCMILGRCYCSTWKHCTTKYMVSLNFTKQKTKKPSNKQLDIWIDFENIVDILCRVETHPLWTQPSSLPCIQANIHIYMYTHMDWLNVVNSEHPKNKVFIASFWHDFHVQSISMFSWIYHTINITHIICFVSKKIQTFQKCRVS